MKQENEVVCDLKNTFDIQMYALINFMIFLGYELENNLFVYAREGKVGSKEITFNNAVMIYNNAEFPEYDPEERKDYIVTYNDHSIPQRTNFGFLPGDLRIAVGSKPMYTVKLQYSRKVGVVAQSHWIKITHQCIQDVLDACELVYPCHVEAPEEIF